MTSAHKQAGFSLVELMVTVAIIGILASMGIADFETFQVEARYKRAEAEMIDISNTIQGLRYADDQVLGLITGNWCTTCSGNPVASWVALGYQTPPVDPWGSPYQMDENENEGGPTDCRSDSLWSAGLDRIYEGPGSGQTVGGDDIIVHIPPYYSHPSCGAAYDLTPIALGPSFKL